MQTFDLTVVDLKPSLLICSVYSLENATVFCIFCPVFFFFTQKYVCGIIAVEFGVIFSVSPSGQLRNRMFFFSRNCSFLRLRFPLEGRRIIIYTSLPTKMRYD